MMKSLGFAVAIFTAWWFLDAQTVHAQSFFGQRDDRFNQATGAETLPESVPRIVAPSAPRANLGVTVVPVTDDAVRQFGLAVRQGALITRLLAGGPADLAGLPLGGVIVAMDGRRIDSPEQLVQAVGAARPDQKIELTYYHGGRLFRKTVQLAPSIAPPTSETPRRPLPSPVPPPDEEEQRPVLGRIGRLIDEFVAPYGGRTPVDPGAREPVAESDQITALKEQVERLRRQIEQLQQRLEELEKRLPSPDHSRGGS